MTLPSTKELDTQNPIKIDEWVSIGFQDPPFLHADNLGRLWGSKQENGTTVYFPFHIEYGRRLVGLRLATKAAN